MVMFNSSLEIPFDRTTLPAGLLEILATQEFIWVIGSGEFEWFNDNINYMQNRRLQTTLLSGDIGAKSIGTAGLFINNHDNEIYGLTCGHVLGRKSTQSYVEQSSPHDFDIYFTTPRTAGN